MAVPNDELAGIFFSHTHSSAGFPIFLSILSQLSFSIVVILKVSLPSVAGFFFSRFRFVV